MPADRVILTYRYRLLPSKRQHRALEQILEAQRQLYNGALEERIGYYRATGKLRTYVDQCRALTECRRDLPDMAACPAQLQRWTLRRLDNAFTGFFRRLKTRVGKAGYPRFRSKARWDSFGFAEFSGIRWDGKRLRFAGLPGGVRAHLHRPLPIGADFRSCVFRRAGRGWSVCLQVTIDPPTQAEPQSAIGVDLGLHAFAYTSDGASIPAPQIARRAERQLRRRQRALMRCRRGSVRRQKVRARVAALHRKIANTRATWLHQQSAALVKRADLIAAEDLNVKGLFRARIARSVADAAWSKFLSMVAYKAERAGKHFVTVDPRNTSQKCSGCGELVPKSLAVRTHSCPYCGLVIDRDWNAARNILAAVVGGGQLNEAQWGERAARNLILTARSI